jgi:hypothetical protein
MKRSLYISAIVMAALAISGCKFQKQYECTITDVRTGKVIRKVKVNFKSECDAIALAP